MRSADAIIVGGGPAGSSCAAMLNRAGMNVLILDRETFPRRKLCAGWITPGVLKTLKQITDQPVPGLTELDRLVFHVYGLRMPLPVRQFAVRRIEFDHWIFRESGTPMIQHTVRNIRLEHDFFVLDGNYRCKWLIGAGGSRCPVYQQFFRDIRKRDHRKAIAAMEVEYQADCLDPNGHLWFFRDGIPGYAWYLPKVGGWLNIGIGGKLTKLKREGQTIRQYWDRFIQRLMDMKWIEQLPPEPGTTVYHLRTPGPFRSGKALVIGDAAGLATLDMGEGISAAIASGIQAARSILQDDARHFRSISRFSLPGILMSRFSRSGYQEMHGDPD